MAFEKCENCGRFGAKKYVDDKGPNGLGGRITETRWLCDGCEDRYREFLRTNLQKLKAESKTAAK